ncbi:MAG: SlyX family protein [Granulosicoccus sp.]
MSDDPNEQRLETLELKIMDLENTVHELHEVVLKQYRMVDALESQLTHIGRQLNQTEQQHPAAPSLKDELPPHY